MIGSAILLAFGAMLFWGIGDFLIQRSTRKIGDVQALAWIGIIGTIGLLPFAIKDISSISGADILMLASLAILVFIGALFNFEALKKGKLAVIDVLLEIELPITVFLSFVFLKEVLTLTQFILIFVILAGIMLIAANSLGALKMLFEKGVVLALVAALILGLINFLTATSAKNISPIMAVWFPWIVMTIFCLVIISRREGIGMFFSNAKDYKWLLLFMGIFDTGAWIFYAYSVEGASVSIITAITESYPAIAMILGIVFNREVMRLHQYIGAILALGGSVALALM